jgi:MFS family permease
LLATGYADLVIRDEIGLPTMSLGAWRAGWQGRSEIFALYAARGVRGLGDGFAAIILPAYLVELGLNPFQVGIVAASALLGSAVLTLVIGIVAPRHDRRTLLLACDR